MENFQVIDKVTGKVYYTPGTFERCQQYTKDHSLKLNLKVVPVMDTKTFRVMDVASGHVVNYPFTKGEAFEDCTTRNDAMKPQFATWTVIELTQVFS